MAIIGGQPMGLPHQDRRTRWGVLASRITPKQLLLLSPKRRFQSAPIRKPRGGAFLRARVSASIYRSAAERDGVPSCAFFSPPPRHIECPPLVNRISFRATVCPLPGRKFACRNGKYWPQPVV